MSADTQSENAATEGVADPVSLSPQTNDWLIRVGQQEYRAPDLQTVIQWRSEGRVPPNAYVWHPSLGQWRMASSLGAAPAPVMPLQQMTGFQQPMMMPMGMTGFAGQPQSGSQHMVPKCLRCGTVTPWTVEPMLLLRHWLIFGVFLLAWGTGLIYLLVVLIIRNNPENRAKVCPYCQAHNLWTFIYEDPKPTTPPASPSSMTA